MSLFKYIKLIAVLFTLSHTAFSSTIVDSDFDCDVKKFAQIYCFDSFLDNMSVNKRKMLDYDPLYYAHPNHLFLKWSQEYKSKFELTQLFCSNILMDVIMSNMFQRIEVFLDTYRSYQTAFKNRESLLYAQAQSYEIDVLSDTQFCYRLKDLIRQDALFKISCLQVMKEIERYHTCLKFHEIDDQNDLYHRLCSLDRLPVILEE